MDRARRKEHRALLRAGDDRLKETRYAWLCNPQHMDRDKWHAFAQLSRSQLRTARAWAYKEHAMTLWEYRTRGWALRAWQRWYASAIRSRLEPLKRYLQAIITALVNRVHNAHAETSDAVVQWLKCSARDFRDAVLFHTGRPRPLSLRCQPVGRYPHEILKSRWPYPWPSSCTPQIMILRRDRELTRSVW